VRHIEYLIKETKTKVIRQRDEQRHRAPTYAGAVSQKTVQSLHVALREDLIYQIRPLRHASHKGGQGLSLVGVIDKRVATDPLVRPPRRRDNSENA